jgi:hypothetical protein
VPNRPEASTFCTDNTRLSLSDTEIDAEKREANRVNGTKLGSRHDTADAAEGP